MTSGEQCVMKAGMQLKRTYCVEYWDIRTSITTVSKHKLC